MTPGTTGLAAACADELDSLRRLVSGLGDAQLVLASACVGWRVADLLVHLRLGAAALLEGLAFTTDEPADRDRLSYWSDFPSPSEITFAHVRFHWATAAAYSSGEILRGHFDDTASAAAAAVRAADAGAAVAPGRIRFQTHVLERADYFAIWAVEFAVHHLDLLVAIPSAEPPVEASLRATTRTIDGLAPDVRLDRWDEATYVRKATGRLPLEGEERAHVAARAVRFPVFG